MANSVLLTIKAPSAEEALKIARGIAGFTVDEDFGAIIIDPQKNEFCVRGVASQAISDPAVETWSDPGIGTFGPPQK
jgi:hypothetical protein